MVCGGGIAGTSVAYHLAERGKKVFLFERDRYFFLLVSHVLEQISFTFFTVIADLIFL